MGQMEAPSSWTKTRRGTKERREKLQGHSADVSDVEMVCGVSHSSSGKEEEPEGWTQFHVGGTDGVGASTFR